jgi:hypothetical protein
MAATEKGTKSSLARELGVSRSSLYYRPKKPDKDEALRREIEALQLKPDFTLAINNLAWAQQGRTEAGKQRPAEK